MFATQMKLPFTPGQFLDIFREYNESVFPMQLVFYLAAIAALVFVVKGNSKSGKPVSWLLALLWLWMGIVYHIIFFSAINKAAFAFGSFFIIQGLVFLYNGVLKNNLSFRFRRTFTGYMGLLMIIFALLIYPVLGFQFGHVYPSAPTFGLPCPTTIFTFGLLMMNEKKIPFYLLVIPVLWSLIGFSAALTLGITEDTGLIIAGLVMLASVIAGKRKLSPAIM